jgi:tetratricopeptide (TPR) repeat protein
MRITHVLLAAGLSLAGTTSILAETIDSTKNEQFASLYIKAQAANDRKDYGSAVKYLDSASKVAESFPKDDCRLVSALDYSAIVFEEQGDYVAAAAIRERIISLYKKRFGESNPRLADAYKNAASTYRSEGRTNEAEINYKKALITYKNVFGLSNVHVAQIATDLGQLYILQGDFDKAAPVYRQAISVYAKNKDQCGLKQAQSEYAEVLEHEGKSSEAKKLLISSL